jgi:hypothetical protein
MGLSAGIMAVTTIGSAIAGNQQKQKAKGQAAQIQRDAQAAQDAADAKAAQLHTDTLVQQSQAAGVARAAAEASPKRSSTLISPTLSSGTPPLVTPNASPLPMAPLQRKTLLGQ